MNSRGSCKEARNTHRHGRLLLCGGPWVVDFKKQVVRAPPQNVSIRNLQQFSQLHAHSVRQCLASERDCERRRHVTHAQPTIKCVALQLCD